MGELCSKEGYRPHNVIILVALQDDRLRRSREPYPVMYPNPAQNYSKKKDRRRQATKELLD